jgi:hypothetical protein
MSKNLPNHWQAPQSGVNACKTRLGNRQQDWPTFAFSHMHTWTGLLAVWEKSVKAAWLFANWHIGLSVPFRSILFKSNDSASLKYHLFIRLNLLTHESQPFVRYDSHILQDIFLVSSNLVTQSNNVMDFTIKKRPLKHSSSLTYMAWFY